MLDSQNPVTVEQAMRNPATAIAQQVLLQAVVSGAVAAQAVRVVAEVVRTVAVSTAVTAVAVAAEAAKSQQTVLEPDVVEVQEDDKQLRDKVDADAAELRQSDAEFAARVAAEQAAKAAADSDNTGDARPIDFSNLRLFAELSTEACVAIAKQATERLRQWFVDNGRNPTEVPVITAEQVQQGRSIVQKAFKVAAANGTNLSAQEATAEGRQQLARQGMLVAATDQVRTDDAVLEDHKEAFIFMRLHNTFSALALSEKAVISAHEDDQMEMVRQAFFRTGDRRRAERLCRFLGLDPVELDAPQKDSIFGLD